MQVKMGGLKMQQIAHDRNSDRLVELEETLQKDNEFIKPEETTIIILTGSGLKVTNFYQQSFGIS